MKPRNTKPIGDILHHDYALILQLHPEAFDCIVFPALPPTHDETIADNTSAATVLLSDERAQEYSEPVEARAMLVPRQELDFDATESGAYEAFTASSEAIRLAVSVPGLRRNSLIQWLEYANLEQDEIFERTVYVHDVEPMGRTLAAGMIYVCYPMPAASEIPEKPADSTGTETCNESYDDIFKPFDGGENGG